VIFDVHVSISTQASDRRSQCAICEEPYFSSSNRSQSRTHRLEHCIEHL